MIAITIRVLISRVAEKGQLCLIQDKQQTYWAM